MAPRRTANDPAAQLDPAPRWERAAFWLACGGSIGVFLLIVAVRQAEPLGLDQGLFACFGRFMLEGWVPYRDIWDHKPPGLPVFYTLAFAAFGPETGSLWKLEALWLLASCGVAFGLGTRLRGRWAGLVAAVTLIGVLWAPMWGGYWARAQAEELIVLPLLGAGWACWRAQRGLADGGTGAGAALLAGVLTGCAAVFKLPAIGLVLAWPWAWLAVAGWRRSLRPGMALAVGTALPWLAVAGVFAAFGAFEDLWKAIVVYPAHYAEAVRASQPWSEAVWRMGNAVIRAIPSSLVGAVIGLSWLSWRRARAALWLGPWTLISIGIVLAQGQGAGYHFQIVAAPLALATGIAVADLAHWARRASVPAGRVAGIAGLVLLAGLAGREALSWVDAYGPALAHRSGRIDRDAYLSELKYGGYEPRALERTAAGIARSTSSGEPILVWGLAPTLYFLADRPPATRFPFHHLLLTEEPLSRALPGLEARREAFLHRLSRDRPAMILVGRGDRSAFEQRDSYAQMVRFEPFHRIVREQYELAGESSRFLVFRRRP
jgi:hypothetical protein